MNPFNDFSQRRRERRVGGGKIGFPRSGNAIHAMRQMKAQFEPNGLPDKGNLFADQFVLRISPGSGNVAA
jgi:hypothetical protein